MPDVRERLLRLSERTADGCREWQAARFPNDYGKITVGSMRDGSRAAVGAHRVAYEAFIGPVPEGLCVLHECDNPGCVEPSHLFLGTHLDNARDRDQKRRRDVRGSRHPRTRLTDGQVMAMRWLVAEGLKLRMVATMFDVSVGLVQKVARGTTWSHLPVLPYSGQRGGSLGRSHA